MDTVTLALRAGLSLACVLGLVWVLAKAARKHPLNRRSATGRTEVLARQQLSRAASLAVVRVGDRTLVLGVTEQQVTLLHEGPLGDEPVPAAALSVLHEEPLSPRADTAEPSAPLSVPHEQPSSLGTDKPRAGRLAGSALSPATWTTAVDVLRERTVRR